ncbi:MAG: hypothetical protein F6J98_34865 [Moorea sp. SIO4G2]|nr:hypothetical protein [Moorena sp. SIO4G2]
MGRVKKKQPRSVSIFTLPYKGYQRLTTCNLQPSTCNLQPATFNLQPLTSNLQLSYPQRAYCHECRI